MKRTNLLVLAAVLVLSLLLVSATLVGASTSKDSLVVHHQAMRIRPENNIIGSDPVNTDLGPNQPENDLGDAPDSTNHFSALMSAYPPGSGVPPGIPANYPTVFNPQTGMPQGPLHIFPGLNSWLGPLFSLEVEADVGPDNDILNNIDPLNNIPDQDGFDDGVQPPIPLPHCMLTSFNFTVTSNSPTPMFVNVWFDWNRDGDWADLVICPDGSQVPEWAVQNQPFVPSSPGQHMVPTLPFFTYNPPPEQPIWMRITIAEQPAPGPEDGHGPSAGYLSGETEDYYYPSSSSWVKTINNTPWEPDILVTVETSDTIEIVDTISTLDPFTLTEKWDETCLNLIDWKVDPAGTGTVISDPGTLTWEVPAGPPVVNTITKTFHVEESTWTETSLSEQLVIDDYPPEIRMVDFQKTPPILWIEADYDPQVLAGQPADFTLEYGNDGGYENDVMVRNEFPPEALFIESLPLPSRVDPARRWVEWDVDDLGYKMTDTIDVSVAIAPDLVPSDTVSVWDGIFNHVGEQVDEVTITFHINEPPIPYPDLGDAPDSSNHFGIGMTAYPLGGGGPPNTPASYPTVFDPLLGLPQGPLHQMPMLVAWLGPGVSPELDADLMPDGDGVTNIWPIANAPDQDGFDDGLQQPVVLPHCVPTTINYLITAAQPTPPMFVNVWFDWDRDGDWADISDCGGVSAPEWAVQNQLLLAGLPPGPHVFQTPAFLPYNPHTDNPIWMRITLSELPAFAPDGSGPPMGYEYGETEDYFLRHTVPPLTPIYLPLITENYTPPAPPPRGNFATGKVDRRAPELDSMIE